jgi:hypothetical protein
MCVRFRILFGGEFLTEDHIVTVYFISWQWTKYETPDSLDRLFARTATFLNDEAISTVL